MGIGTLGWWELIKRFFQWLFGSYLEYVRKKKARAEQKAEAKTEYEKAQKSGNAADMLNAMEKLKRSRNE